MKLLATLFVGLREESRTKMYLLGAKSTRTDILMAAVVDRLSMLLWMLSEDGKNGINRPKSIISAILGTQEEENKDKVEAFEKAEDFENAWEAITGVKYGR